MARIWAANCDREFFLKVFVQVTPHRLAAVHFGQPWCGSIFLLSCHG